MFVGAVEIAKKYNFTGIVVNSDALLLAPTLISAVKKTNLILFTYGSQNNEPDNVDIQETFGVYLFTLVSLPISLLIVFKKKFYTRIGMESFAITLNMSKDEFSLLKNLLRKRLINKLLLFTKKNEELKLIKTNYFPSIFQQKQRILSCFTLVCVVEI